MKQNLLHLTHGKGQHTLFSPLRQITIHRLRQLLLHHRNHLRSTRLAHAHINPPSNRSFATRLNLQLPHLHPHLHRTRRLSQPKRLQQRLLLFSFRQPLQSLHKLNFPEQFFNRNHVRSPYNRLLQLPLLLCFFPKNKSPFGPSKLNSLRFPHGQIRNPPRFPCPPLRPRLFSLQHAQSNKQSHHQTKTDQKGPRAHPTFRINYAAATTPTILEILSPRECPNR